MSALVLDKTPEPSALPASVLTGETVMTRTLDVAVVGPGHVGACLLQQLRDGCERLKYQKHIHLRLRAVIDSRHLWLDQDDDELNARCDGAQTWRPANLDALADYLDRPSHAVIVDCTASEEVVRHYDQWLAAGINIVTPNKIGASGSLDYWRQLRRTMTRSGALWLHETTVGAGLPVISTLSDLLDTGDKLLSIEGMFSGSMAWLFYRYDGSQPFSGLVHEAARKGYTEPDPREDLGGMDVARKLVILARHAGIDLSLDNVAIQSLVPKHLATVDKASFMRRLPELDADMKAYLTKAEEQDSLLRYVGRITAKGQASVKLEVVPRSHALAGAQLTDNMIVFKTKRYSDNPLVVQGPGAGPEVTAAGVFADILHIARQVEPA